MVALRRDPIGEAIRALQGELDGGPRADLQPLVETLGSLFLERQARANLAEKERPERELLAALPDATALVGKDGRIRVANTPFEALTPGGRAIGLTPLEVTRQTSLEEATRRALEGTEQQLEVQLSRRQFSAHVKPLLRGEVLLSMRDITGTKRIEAVRRDFVANASHELRTPVTAIAASAETLLGGALSDPEQGRHFVSMIARQAERLARLTSDLLDLSRIESGERPLDLRQVLVDPLARRVLDLHAAAAKERSILLRNQVSADLGVRADIRALEQVLVNLVDNAVQYSSEGGTVTICGVRQGAHTVLSVEDTGPGIEHHHLTRLFERFYRIDPGRSRESGGTGLGLALVKHLIQAQYGEVGVESGSGGSRFWVRLLAE